MFATKRRLIAMVLAVGFLVASLGMFAPPAYSSSCQSWIDWCCQALKNAAWYCLQDPNGEDCYDAQNYAGGVCGLAANICGYPTYHLCVNN